MSVCRTEHDICKSERKKKEERKIGQSERVGQVSNLGCGVREAGTRGDGGEQAAASLGARISHMLSQRLGPSISTCSSASWQDLLQELMAYICKLCVLCE